MDGILIFDDCQSVGSMAERGRGCLRGSENVGCGGNSDIGGMARGRFEVRAILVYVPRSKTTAKSMTLSSSSRRL